MIMLNLYNSDDIIVSIIYNNMFLILCITGCMVHSCDYGNKIERVTEGFLKILT